MCLHTYRLPQFILNVIEVFVCDEWTHNLLKGREKNVSCSQSQMGYIIPLVKESGIFVEVEEGRM